MLSSLEESKQADQDAKMENLNKRSDELERSKKEKDSAAKAHEEEKAKQEATRKQNNQGFLAGIKSFQIDDI